ncbi:techylectin-5A-like [Penaeus japonicus]|uniref:techylectin-5A-like n=1 Tax=Penaeus japonicus TaxID=27405 RepID=UPI001C70B2EA|nr:techylectin-5A-like [Penaeus japonicus]
MKQATMIWSSGSILLLATLIVGKPASEVNVDSSGSVVNLQGAGNPGGAQVNVDMPGQVNMSADGQALVLLLSEKGQGLRVDINGVLVSDLVDDNGPSTAGPGQVTTQPPVYHTTQPPMPQTTRPPVPQTTQPPVPQTTQPTVPQTTRPPVPQSTQPPVPQTTRPPVPQTTQPPVPQTTRPPVPQTTRPPVPQTTMPPVPQTTQPPVPQTTRPPVPQTTQPPMPPITRNCLTKKMEGYTSSGIYTLQPYDCCPNRNVDAPCDMTTDGGGWTVIQRRQENPSHQEDFYRTWDEYVDGFGDLRGEFWLGLEHIHALTNQSNYEIRFDLTDWAGVTRWAKYSTFLVKGRASDYQLELGSYSGDAGNSFAYHNMMPFSAKGGPVKNACPESSHGGWWYNSCHYVNLNGVYRQDYNSDGDSVCWVSFRGPNYSLKFSEMKIRPTP